MPTLNWLTRDDDLRAASRVPYRLLEEASELSAGEPDAGNMLIQGDNLEALKALLPFYAGQVKCIYIDPPYNTRSAFEHYDDNLEHTQWLEVMWPRLELLRDLLAEDGSIWVSIDDNEAHYLKIIMDEIFGRSCFVACIVWQSKDTPGNNATGIAETHSYALVYKKSEQWTPNLIPRTERQLANYKNPDNDPRGPWLGTPLTRAEHRDRDYYPLTNDMGHQVYPPKGSSWRRPPETMKKLATELRIYWGKDGNSDFPMEKKFLSEVKQGVTPQTWWPYEFSGSTRNASAELKGLSDGSKSFDTPKPERFPQRILEIATNSGDLILDSFLGSGTTAAVAHKMRRRYIGVEMGEHAVTHCVPRLQKVIDGEQGGISKSAGWQGGGGFRFYRLGPTVFDEQGHIRQDIRFPTLAAHVWFSETRRPWNGKGDSPLLGLYDDRAYALLYNGILGDKRPANGNVLTRATLARIRDEITRIQAEFDGPLTVYGEQSRLTPATLDREGIVFKQMPYDVKASR